MARRCTKCKELFDISCFYVKRRSLSGQVLYRSECKKCTNKARIEVYYKEKAVGKHYYARKKHDTTFMEQKRHRERQYSKNNPEVIRKKAKKFAGLHGDNRCYNVANNRARKLLRAPKWLTKKHLDSIKTFYKKARHLTKVTGVQYDVDHIYPLCGKTCSGLHVPWNLQVITHKENCQKTNNMRKEI